jgi:hypothetical protein
MPTVSVSTFLPAGGGNSWAQLFVARLTSLVGYLKLFFVSIYYLREWGAAQAHMPRVRNWVE